MNPSTNLAERSQGSALVERVRSEEFRREVALLLPDDVPPERFARVATTALLQNPELAQADPQSVMQALLRAAQDGLLPDGREAALVIFNVKVKDEQGERWVKKAQYLAMIGGYRKIAADHGWSLQTAVVYANDEFDYELGLDERLIHQPVRPGAERGEAIAAYAIARHRDGRRTFEVLNAAEIDKVRKSSRAGDKGPWKDWTERMWEKTAGRRLFAKLPLGEHERERIQRILAEDFEPGEAAAAVLYGQRRPELTQASPGATPAKGAAVSLTDPLGGDGVVVPDNEANEPGPARTDGILSDEPGPATSPDREKADKAGAFNPESAKWPGKTIREIFESGPEGEEWVRWCVQNAKRKAFAKAVREFAAVYVPDALEAEVAQ